MVSEVHTPSEQIMSENREESDKPKVCLAKVVGKRLVPCIILKQEAHQLHDGSLQAQEFTTRSDSVYEMEEIIVEEECKDDTMEYEVGTTTYYISETSLPNSEEFEVDTIDQDEVVEEKQDSSSVIFIKVEADDNEQSNNNLSHIQNDHLYYSPDPDDNENSECESVCRYSIEQFKDDEKGILYFTGLDSYGKFIAIFHTLGNSSHEMNFDDSQSCKLSAENKLFLTLWKLRKNCEDYELGKHFGISKESMRTVFKKMILYMVSKFSLLDIWPTPEFMQPYIPKGTEINYFPPTTSRSGRSVILTNLENYVKKNIKKFKILSQKLHPAYSHLGSEITGICIILCAFMEIIKV